METIELFYPEICVNVGRYCFTKGIEIEVYSSQNSYFDWAKIRFTGQFKEKITIAKKEVATISLGYQGVFHEVFQGYVSKEYDNSNGMNEILLKDDMILLEETSVTNTFLDGTPQDILSYCLGKAGISQFQLVSHSYRTRKTIPVFKKNVIDVIEFVHSLWGIHEKFFFSEGVFYWGEKPTPNTTYEFEYGENIISLGRENGKWILETVSVPFIKHSHQIVINHPQVSGTFEVEKVVFITNSSGFIRTYLYF